MLSHLHQVWHTWEYTLLTILHGLWTPSTPKKSRQRLYFLHQLRKFRASAPISCVSWQHHLVWELYSLWLQHRIIRASLHILQETYKKRLTYQRPRYCKGFLTSWPWTFQNTEVRQTSLLLQDQNRETEEELLSSSDGIFGSFARCGSNGSSYCGEPALSAPKRLPIHMFYIIN